MDDNIPKDTAPEPKTPDPITQNLNSNHTTKAIGADVRLDEERVPGIVKESTVWDVYNNEARKVDNELVKDWTASLNFLLVFAAIFAAVLTAFIIESKKMLEPDQTEILVDITIQYFNSISNTSRANLTRPDFEPTSAAISINCCLFASLGASLVAALASVVSLQWVADYDAAITRGGSSPEDRAKRRQFRHAGVLRWKMGEIIASLPLLLYSSVILFWAGAIQWMWELHHIVGYVVAGGTAIAVLFYISTTLLGAIYVSSPFRTPLSRGLYWLPRWSLSLLGRFLLWLPIETLLRGLNWLYQNISSLTSATVISDRGSFDSSALSIHPMHPTLSETIPRWIRNRLLIKDTSRHREDEAAKQDPAFQQQALAWLAEQLPISADSHNRLLLFTSGMLTLPRENRLSPRFLETPWLAILEFLSTHYMQKIRNPSTSAGDCEGLDVLLQLIHHPCIRTKVVPRPGYNQDHTVMEYWEQYPGRWRFGVGDRPKDIASMTFLLARDIPIPSPGSKYELETAFKLIKWRNSTEVLAFNSIWSEVFNDIQHYSPEFFTSCLRLLNMVLPMETGYQILGARQSLHMIVEQALSRALTVVEAIELAQAFATSIRDGSRPSTAVEKDDLIPHPLAYGYFLAKSPQETQVIQHTITLLVARAAHSVSDPDQWKPKWVQWVVMMLWIGSSKEPGYWETLIEEMGERADWGNLWGRVDMTMGGLPAKSPHIQEIMTLLATLMARLDLLSLFRAPLWINSMDGDGKRSQAIRMLASFDKIVVTESWPQLHRTLVGLICEDMRRAGIQWPSSRTGSKTRISSSNNQEAHLRQLAHIKDPCFAMMGAFACGIQRSDMLTWNGSQHSQHDGCLQALRSLVFRRLYVDDPPALWEFRAAMVPLNYFVIEEHFEPPFFEPEVLAYLELLLEHPTQFHSTGSQHLLLLLYEYAAKYGLDIRMEARQFMNLNWEQHNFNVILAMLYLCDTHEPSDLDLTEYGAECTQRIWAICKAVKRQPREFFCLLVDIATNQIRQYYPIADIAIILECVKQASTPPEDETTTPLLRPLSLALQEILGRMVDWRDTPEEGEMVSEETRRICDVLHAKSAKALICSPSHLQMLSCAHSAAAAQPAIGWLRMHVEL